MKNDGVIDQEQQKQLTSMVKQSKQYLNGDFKYHAKNESKIAEHCWTFALSDPSESAFRSNQESSHNHDLQCASCLASVSAFDFIQETLEKFKREVQEPATIERVNEWLYDLNGYQNDVHEFKKHQMRVSFSATQRRQFIETLQEGECLLTIDFAQKLLPLRTFERQSVSATSCILPNLSF